MPCSTKPARSAAPRPASIRHCRWRKAANGNADFEIIPDGEALRFTLYRDNRTPEGIGEFSRRTVADLTFLADAKG